MSESTVSALITALQDNDSDVRFAAVEALGNQSTMSESTLSALITALQDDDPYVRQVAAKALGNQSTLSESTISQIVATADDRSFGIYLTIVLRTPRFFLSNKLQVFTEQGFEETGELSNEVLCKIESTFLALQSSGGIEMKRNLS
ncbi:hypothetical protein BGZ76_011414 [Entomortierella beljakovae]|nr:hypothetical protein BGZ76_011414 [Entomortierella beljakovae]